MTFRIGQQVACITDEGWENVIRGDRTTGPAKGDVVTITNIWRTDVTWLIFAEWGEDGFEATAFRPVVTRPTSIAVFEKILRDGSREVEAV